jgi:Ti-type conjugative transfer relaxase TraA
MIPRLKVGTGVTGAVRYALGEGRDPFTNEVRKKPANDRSRVEWIGGINVGFPVETREDADLARRIMEFDALNQTSPTKRCVKDCVHLALGWRPGEEPTREQMEAAARGALKALGMENAKAVFVAHNDEDYFHLHIVASKLNPETERAYDLKQSYLKLSRWAEQYERDHSGGIVCTRRAEANQLREAIDERNARGVLELMTERRSTFTGQDLERALSKQIRSDLSRAQFAEAVLNHPDAVHLSDQAESHTSRYSTKAIVETEQHVLRAAQGLARNGEHQVGERVLTSVLSENTFDGISREQALAVRHATGANGLALIDGQAGTGKSYILNAIRQSYEAQGCKVIGLAPTNIVAQDMQRDGFAKAGTVHSELFSLNNERTQWDKRTVVMVDEAAMVDSRNMAMLTAHAYASGAKLILIGDDRQLSSIERGGMFGVLKDRYGAAVLAEVRRQQKNDDRRAAELMAEGNFHDALARYDTKGAIHWTRTQPEARAALVAQWAKDNASDPTRSRFVFAYTNADVDQLNRDIRQVRKETGQLEQQDYRFETKHGPADFSSGDRIQFTGTHRPGGLYNGQAGTVQLIDGSRFVVRLDGRGDRSVEFDAGEFQDFRHGYAGTIYKGQGRTLDQTYLYHSEHWRSSAGYVALTRHRDKAELFVARNTAPDLKQLARQIARVDERRAAVHFHESADREPVRPLTPRELAARLSDPALQRRYEREQQRREQEQGSSIEPALREESTASRDARETAKFATGSETGDATQRRLSRLLNEITGGDTTPTQGVGRTKGGGRTRTR